MSDTITLSIDGKEIKGRPGETILDAAGRNGVYIPRLCAFKDLSPYGSCRVCTVMANGRPTPACTQPIAEGMMVESDTETVGRIRRDLIDMLFVEGNHFCMFCEKSGNCELQALAYRFGITAPRFPFLFPDRDIDASHPEVYNDRNRCVLCARCVRASRESDGKHVFEMVERGPERRIGVNSAEHLGDTEIEATDRAVAACPVGALMRKRIGYSVPIGQRLYDTEPIGSDIEQAPAGE
jgi:[NiFe] hydrogenase diaphorase moiety small subunit